MARYELRFCACLKKTLESKSLSQRRRMTASICWGPEEKAKQRTRDSRWVLKQLSTWECENISQEWRMKLSCWRYRLTRRVFSIVTRKRTNAVCLLNIGPVNSKLRARVEQRGSAFILADEYSFVLAAEKYQLIFNELNLKQKFRNINFVQITNVSQHWEVTD